MTDEPRCPYAGTCPHVAKVEDELHREGERLEAELGGLHRILSKTNCTLYLIAGILSLHLGLMIL